MKVAGVKEFRDHVPEYLSGKDLVFVTKHGKVSSLLVPLEKTDELPFELRSELLTRLGDAISSQLSRRHISEDKIADDFKAWRKAHRSRGRGR